MALRPYERQEQIDPRVRKVDYSAPEVADVGRTFRQLSGSLLQAAEPVIQEGVKQQALADAGRAPIVRDSEGNLTRAEPLPGGGLVYAEVFRRASSNLYKGRLIADSETRFEEIRAANIDNPGQALVEMRAHIDAVKETIPPDIRDDIEPDLLREAMQRFNGLSGEKVRRDRALTIEGLETLYKGEEAKYITDIGRLAESQDFEAITARVAQWEKFATENRTARAGLYALDSAGAAGEAAGLAAKTDDVAQEVVSIQGVLGVVKEAKQLLADPQQLQILEEWARGDPTAGQGKVLGMTYDDYVKSVPTERGRNQLSTWASKQLSDLDRAAAEKAASDKAAADAKKDEDLFNSIAVHGADAISGSKEARDEWNNAVNRYILSSSINMTEFMMSENGQQFMVGQVRDTGVMPDALKTYIERQATGTNAHLIMGFVEQMTGTRGPMGQYNGMLAWKQLSGPTRAVITKYREMSDAGIPTNVRREMLDKIATDQVYKGKLADAFKDEEGKPSIKLYVETRDKWVKGVFGVDHSQIPTPIRDQIDKDVRSYLSVYGDDADGAVRAAVEGAATMWTVSPFGMHGYLPTELAGLQLTPSQLDYAFGNYVPGKGHVHGGAGFTTTTHGGLPRARIELADDSQLPAGLGNYRITYYDIDGHPIDAANVNIDKALADHFGSMQKLQAQMRLARIAAAKTKREQQLEAAAAAERYALPVVP